MDIDLGFVEENDSEWLVNRYFPSKLGGKPAWLDLKRLPRTDELKCENCGLQKIFLCQVYASLDKEEAFHRMIYVFYCRSLECQQNNKNWMVSVFRSQLPLENPFYSLEPPKESGKPLPFIPTNENLCVCCGCLGPFACGACKKVHYCSRAHQKKHYRYHKSSCSPEKNEKSEPLATPKDLVTFPEYEIVIEKFDIEENDLESDEDDDGGEDNEEKEKEQMAVLEKLKSTGKAGTLDEISETELAKYVGAEESLALDKYFKIFKKAISKEPTQVIRYDRGGKPLWIANPSETIQEQKEIPKCENCGSDRQFEFQIMPQMLNSLKDSNLDWGTLAIFTCKESCKPSSDDQRYLREYVIKQDIQGDSPTSSSSSKQ